MNAWAKDPQIVCVLLRGNGPKAFCAGGECAAWWRPVAPIRVKYRHWPRSFLRRSIAWTTAAPTPKPLICWGHGYVLGGGMGLLQGASTRIVTPSSRLAMPEISIGLYPDVGASWFLSRLPGKLGLFLQFDRCAHERSGCH